MSNQVLHGDCLEVLKTLEDNSVDSIVTDPPAGIGFMSKSWDAFDNRNHKSRQGEKDTAEDTGKWLEGRGTLPYGFSPSLGHTRKERENFISFMTDVFTEALRVLKPGGHAFVWALPRTSHWTALALEDAGFEIRDSIAHMFGSGFPKSLSVDKAIDKYLGQDRTETEWYDRYKDGNDRTEQPSSAHVSFGCHGHTNTRTKPATPEAQQWNGWGSSTKPSHETWWLVRKPLAEKSIAANVLHWGTGAINVDASRIGIDASREDNNYNRAGKEYKSGAGGSVYGSGKGFTADMENNTFYSKQGRFPSNTLLSHTLLCQPRGEKRVRGHTPGNVAGSAKSPHEVYGTYAHHGSGIHYTDSDGMETVAAYDCSEDCPVFLLDQQSGVSCHKRNGSRKGGIWNNEGEGGTINAPGDTGGASRYYQCFPPDDMPPFLYTSKASRAERNRGCETLPERDKATAYGDGLNSATKVRTTEQAENGVDRGKTQNGHPTVKPLSLLKYLISMITPANGIVLDMFAGSGSTGVACVQNGFRYILIEAESEYVDIIHARLAHAHSVMPVQEQEDGEYLCSEDCPVRVLGEQSGVRKSGGGDKHGRKASTFMASTDWEQFKGTSVGGDTGTAARFFQTFPPDSLFYGMEEEAL